MNNDNSGEERETTNKHNHNDSSNDKKGKQEPTPSPPQPKLAEYTAYKYSNRKKDPLHESIILSRHPFFIKYENNEVELVGKIEEGDGNRSRIIKPPRIEEYPYEPYEFADLNEIRSYINRAKNSESLDSLYFKAKSMVQQFIDQDNAIIILLAADAIWSYYQDFFPTTHYIDVCGDPETGKSSIGYTFEYTGYRPVRGTSITTANYYRTLGTIEPGQCTIIEDEADNIEEDYEKMRVLKSGYEYSTKVPRINMNSSEQKQNWFYGYCFKMRIAENPLDLQKAKGLVERIFVFRCKPSITNNKYSIKEVVAAGTNTFGELTLKQQLYSQLIDFRKLMLCFRLIHYRDTIPDINTGLKNRDKELGGPLLQLFQGTKALSEIAYALEVFLGQKKERKANTLEAAVLYPLIINLIAENNNTYELTLGQIWESLINRFPGKYDPRKPDQYQTYEYGMMYRNTISIKIADKFGAERKRKNNGIVLIFDKEKLRQFEERTYNNNNGRVSSMMEVPTNNVPEHESVGSEGCAGSGECANTTSAIQVYHANDKIQLFPTITSDSIYSTPTITTTTNNENITDGQDYQRHHQHQDFQQTITLIKTMEDDAITTHLLLPHPQSSLTADDDLAKLLFCPFCNDDYKTNDAIDMELHMIREHREKLV